MNTNNYSDRWREPSCPSEIRLKDPDDVNVPELDEIPAEFENKEHWIEFQRQWFEDGLEIIATITARDDINASVAFAHLSAIQNAFGISCERKRLAVAWLASMWFVDWTRADNVQEEPVSPF